MDKEKEVKCLNCQNKLEHVFVDLGTSPLCNDYVKPEHVNTIQQSYPLVIYVCANCFLVQVGERVSPEKIYSDYYYFSSYSHSWLQHAKRYVELMVGKYGISREHFVVEIASNDGYLLQYFKKKEIPILGVEPSENVARASIEKGIPTEKVFFGEETAKKLKVKYAAADVILGNNVLAHVPDINDFIKGLDVMLNEEGIMTFEFPHLFQLVKNKQFDTIYHEHFFYYSLIVVESLFKKHGMRIFDVQQLSTHGGSVRIFVARESNKKFPVNGSVERALNLEIENGYLDIDFYKSFGRKVQQLKTEIVTLVEDVKNHGHTLVGYGAPGKGNTLLNYCEIGRDMIDYTVDRNPSKQGHYLPGSLIPIYHPAKIRETKPDYVFILPWNLKDEIMEQLSYVRDWDGKFIIPIPEPVIE